jgi:HTH-type transcriptional regulator, sugar sensing transcriptional regulator
MYVEILREIGLTNSEIAVYLALVKIGPSTTGPIVKEAKISSGKVYEILDKLIEKGVVSYIIKAGRKYFQPTDPSRFREYIEKKEKSLEETKTKLDDMMNHFDEEISKKQLTERAEIFEGRGGFRTFSDFVMKELKKETDYCILGVSKEVNEVFGAYLLDWQKQRAKKGVHLRIIYNEDAKEFGKKRKKISKTDVRYLPNNMKTPALIEIFDDYVATMIVVPKPIIFLIKSKEAAESYLQYFNLMWKQARKKLEKGRLLKK